MKNQLLCLLLLCAVLICGCAAGEDVSSGEPQSEIPSAGVSSEGSVDASEDTSSDPGTEETENPPEETDFFSANGQDVLPETASLPAICEETDTTHLYTLSVELPDGIDGIEWVQCVGKTVHIRYTLWIAQEESEDYDIHTFYRICSAETGELLTEKQLPQNAYSGPLSDGGFWYATPEGVALTLCGTDGTETVARQASSNYTGTLAPHLLALSADGGTLLAAFNASEPFLLFDLATGARTRVSAGVRAQSWTLLATDEDSFLLAGSRGALVDLSISGASAEVLPERDPVCGVAGDLFLLADVTRGLVLRGQAPDRFGTQLLFVNFLSEEETVSALAFGCCATASPDGSVRFYDLREGACISSVLLEGMVFPTVDFREDGTALLSDGSRCYLFDLPAAYGEGNSVEADAVKTEFAEADTLKICFSQLAEKLEDTYGITLYTGSAGNDFNVEGYVGRAELEPVVIYDALQRIDSILSLYPEGMLRETYDGICESLQIYLCADLYGYASDGLSKAGGLTATDGQDIVVVLDVYNGLETTLPHELSHVFDVRIASAAASSGQDWLWIWETIHPFDDAYLYSYEGYQSQYAYTFDGESRQARIWFIDSYSRSFPTEDRARIMEYLFDPYADGLSEALQSPHLLEKARFYSYILRQCFPSCAASSQPIYWETYLGTIDENAVASFLPAA